MRGILRAWALLGVGLVACAGEGDEALPDGAFGGPSDGGGGDGTQAPEVDAAPVVPDGCEPRGLRLRLTGGSDAYHECIREVFAPFDVEYVESGEDIHVIVGGTCQMCGWPSNTCTDCLPEKSYCEVFEAPTTLRIPIDGWAFGSNSHPDVQCWITARSIGHLYGLDAQFLCKDPMSWISGCGRKTFQYKDAPCGEHASRECLCDYETQNSYRHLLCHIGPAR